MHSSHGVLLGVGDFLLLLTLGLPAQFPEGFISMEPADYSALLKTSVFMKMSGRFFYGILI